MYRTITCSCQGQSHVLVKSLQTVLVLSRDVDGIVPRNLHSRLSAEMDIPLVVGCHYLGVLGLQSRCPRNPDNQSRHLYNFLQKFSEY